MESGLKKLRPWAAPESRPGLGLNVLGRVADSPGPALFGVRAEPGLYFIIYLFIIFYKIRKSIYKYHSYIHFHITSTSFLSLTLTVKLEKCLLAVKVNEQSKLK